MVLGATPRQAAKASARKRRTEEIGPPRTLPNGLH